MISSAYSPIWDGLCCAVRLLCFISEVYFFVIILYTNHKRFVMDLIISKNIIYSL